MSYLHKQTILIERLYKPTIQQQVALKSPNARNQPIVTYFTSVSLNKYCLQPVVTLHDILWQLSYSSPSPSHTHQHSDVQILNFQSLYLWLYWCQRCRISNTSSLALEVSSKKALEFQATCKGCHKMAFSKFDSVACAFQETILDIQAIIKKNLKGSRDHNRK